MEYFTQSNILFVIGLGGIIFTLFKAFYDPQKKSETNDLLMDQKTKFLKEEYDKKFALIQADISTLTVQNKNHLHTLDVKLDTISSSVGDLRNSVVKLETIVEERIPKKE